MFFVLSKTAAFLALPSNLFILIGLVGLALMLTRFARAGRRLAVTSLLLLVIFGFSPLGNFAALSLENRFPQWDASRGAPDGIIILGGAISPDRSAERGEAIFTGSIERITASARLARQYPNARVVYSGGRGSIDQDGPGEADFILPVLERYGVARERITLEGRSRNTAENAAFTKAMVNPKPGERWLLVTSAQHMPRSVGCFRAVGFAIEPYPVDWRATRWRDVLFPFNALSGGLRRTDLAVHEWIGLIAYRLTGRSSELFPAPDVRL
jgi:uncharacterized SAM-binding protein YcdF (DUF218 family)